MQAQTRPLPATFLVDLNRGRLFCRVCGTPIPVTVALPSILTLFTLGKEHWRDVHLSGTTQV